MNLTPREKDKLLVAMAAVVARRRLKSGRRRACALAKCVRAAYPVA